MSQPTTEPIGKDSVMNEIFLTPRVIDAGAFGKYSAALRELIDSSVTAEQRLTEERERTLRVLERAEVIASRGEGTSCPAPAGSSSPSDSISADRIARLEVTVAELAGRLEQAEASAAEAKSLAKGRANDEAQIGAELTPEFDEALARAEAAETRLKQLIHNAEQAGENLSGSIGAVIEKAATQGSELTAMIMMLAEQVEKAEAVQGLEQLGSETVQKLGNLIKQGHEIATNATAKVNELEALNIRADASGEALLRAVRAATDGAMGAEAIADRLSAQIARAALVRPAIDRALSTASGDTHAPAALLDREQSETQTDSLAAGERLSIGSVPDSELVSASIQSPGNGGLDTPGVDLGSFVERAAAAEESQTNPALPMDSQTKTRAASVHPARPFPPTPLAPGGTAPSIDPKPTLRRLINPIDAEDFGVE